ncbi:TPA: hydrogenase/urease maturation nickel metallochaperone HypA [Escherichia coli]|uniref:hydrogenase/urease maturation nickel metallochaperone HypA n=1 Tax=Escherichia coli TaxID=562 RepID=UPI002100F793|nr:hydrogenase/urease maturation nickel metallochaperone HypA [Escherichia coli]MCW3246242.1 hydrogenase/urease maturation nickel metallochaperone HypA [Escherichia coli]
MAQSMIEQLENNSLIYGYNKVSFVLIEVGNIACIETESLMFCLDIVSRGTLAENATFAVQKKERMPSVLFVKKMLKLTMTIIHVLHVIQQKFISTIQQLF